MGIVRLSKPCGVQASTSATKRPVQRANGRRNESAPISVGLQPPHREGEKLTNTIADVTKATARSLPNSVAAASR